MATKEHTPDSSEAVFKDSKYRIRIDGGKELTIYYIVSRQVAAKAAAKLLASPSKTLGFDIETGKLFAHKDNPKSGLEPNLSFISLMQFYDPDSATIYLFDCPLLGKWKGILLDVITKKRLIVHNALFDDKFLTAAGYPNCNVDCTMIMYNLVRSAKYGSQDEEEAAINAREAAGEDFTPEEGDGTVLDFLGKGERWGASLRSITAKLLGIEVHKDLQRSDWTSRPLKKNQLIYAAKDSYFTYECGKILSKDIVDLGISKVYKLNKAAMKPVIAMMLAGNKIDTAAHAEHIVNWQQGCDALHVNLLKKFKGVKNINSTTQLGRYLETHLSAGALNDWPRSEKTGALKLDAKTLSKYKQVGAISDLLGYKKLQKMLSTYGQRMLDDVNPVTNRLHCSYTLGYTATGRMSCRQPNLQNLPRDASIRSIFIAGDGNTIVGADYSQIEIRVAAELSRDRTMLRVYEEGRDIYVATASKILGKPESTITKPERQIAKSLCLGLIYGLGAKGLIDYSLWNYGVAITEKQAWEYYNAFFNTYSRYAAWQQRRREEFANLGTTTTVVGKVRKLQEVGAYTRSVNHPVQGSAAEVVLTALCNVHKYLVDYPHIRLINCVHDEILLECPKENAEHASTILKSGMEAAMLEIFPQATLNKLVDVKTGLTWAETH